jgi:hypothetical protein
MLNGVAFGAEWRKELPCSHEIFISRVTIDPSIRNVKLKNLKSEQILIFEINKDYCHVLEYQSTISNHLALFMFVGSSIAETQHVFYFLFTQ